MPTSKVHPARSVVPAETASKSTKASAKEPAAAKAKTSNSPSAGKGLPRKAKSKGAAAKPTLLAGGNPQIANADGDAPVQAYIAAMPGWKSGVERRLDALIVRSSWRPGSSRRLPIPVGTGIPAPLRLIPALVLQMKNIWNF